MAFDPTVPQNGQQFNADVVRIQLNALNDSITAIPAGPAGPAGAPGADGATGAQGNPGNDADPIVGAVTGIVKADGAGTITAATPGTDYLTPTGDGSGLSGVLTTLAGHNVSELTNDAGYLTSSSVPTMIAGTGGAGEYSALTIDSHGIVAFTMPANGVTPNVNGAQIALRTDNVSQFPNDAGFITAAAIPTNVSSFTNDAGYSSFNPALAGELYSCFGIFDGGNLTNGVRLGGNQVDLQLWNGGQTVVVLSAGQKQLIGYPDYANPVPTVAAGWADGVLRDGAGNAFSTGAYTPANSGHWAGTPPATVAEAIDRLAAAVSNTGTTPVP